MIFHLPNRPTDIRLKKDNNCMILKIVKNRTVTLYEECAHESEFFTNGTFKLGNAMKRHSGDYVLEEFGSDGVLVKKVNVHLEIQGRLKCFSETKISLKYPLCI